MYDLTTCRQCDSKIRGILNDHIFYKCGRVIYEGIGDREGVMFTCDPRKTKCRCRADNGRRPVMGTFADFIEKHKETKRTMTDELAQSFFHNFIEQFEKEVVEKYEGFSVHLDENSGRHIINLPAGVTGNVSETWWELYAEEGIKVVNYHKKSPMPEFLFDNAEGAAKEYVRLMKKYFITFGWKALREKHGN